MLLPLILSAILLSFTGCLSKERTADGSASRGANSATYGSVVVKSVFPATPVVTLGGTLRLTSVVTDGSGNYLESTISNPVSVTWSSSDTSVITVDERGTLYGKKEGKAIISLVAKQGQAVSETYTVTVNVVNLNVVDVAEVYLSLNSAYIDINAERTFRLTAVDQSGAQTSLSEGSVEFTLSNDNITIDNQKIELAAGGAAVEITITGVSKGYSFVTPIYNITDGDETVKITGTPLVIQVKDPAESSRPSDTTVDAGNYLSMSLNEKDGKKIIHVAHYDKTYKSFSYSVFDGTWTHDYSALPLELHGGDGIKMVLSPFEENENRPIAVMMQGNRPTMWYQNWPENYWLETDGIATSDTIDSNNTYADGMKFLDVAAYEDSSNTNNNRIHIAYFDTIKNEIHLLSYASPTEQTKHNWFSTSINGSSGEIEDLSLSINNVTGEPRLVYTEQNSSVYYVTRQSGKIYREKVTNTTGKEKSVTLKLDGNNVPMVVYYTGVQLGMYYRTLVSGSYIWAFKNISGLDPIPQKISSVDFAFDSYNEPKVAFSADDKIRFARRVPFNSSQDKWVVEAPGDSGTGVQGAYTSIAIDSANRAHIVYSITDTKWFSYWAEPNFFDYRVYPQTNYVGADVINP